MIDRDLLSQIVAATKNGSMAYTSKLANAPMLSHNPPLVEVNDAMTDPNDATKIATRSLPAAEQYLSQPETNGAAAGGEKSKYEIITNAALPPAKRRGNPSIGGGVGSKYPFAELEVGGSFFSPNSDHKKGDAVKGLGSTVSAQNDKYSQPTGEKKKVTRAVRDKVTKKAALDEAGKKITETVELDVKKYDRKFTIRPVEAGKKYGEWTAPADGALIARTV